MHLLPTGGTPQEVPKDLSGRHVVSTPVIGDPNFERTVIFILSFGDEGTLGVVLNRPQVRDQTPPAATEPRGAQQVLQNWQALILSTEPAQLFTGGPVSPDTIIGLAAAQTPDNTMAPIRHAPGTFTLDLDQDPDGLAVEPRHLRLFQGYAGWGPGQLEEEIRSGGWFVARATQSDLFTANPTELWSSVLKRQPGSRRWFSLYPDSPAAN